MAKIHNYETCIQWTGNTDRGTETYNSYQRSYNIVIDGKNIIEGSSDPAFSGDKTKHNPEELFLASVSSCHVLCYLHLYATQKIVVTEYTDNATAIMQGFEKGSGKFTEAVLTTIVTITDAAMTELAKSLHSKANEMCFIANSVNFKVKHNSNIVINRK